MDNRYLAEIEKGVSSYFWKAMTDRIEKFRARVMWQFVTDPIEKHGELQGKIRAIEEILGYPEALKKELENKGITD